MKMKLPIATVLIALLFAISCKTLTSTTTIGANNSFVLGNNTHRPFSVQLKNISRSDIVVHQEPISGGQHSFETIKPRQTLHIYADKDTGLVIENKSGSEVKVELLVRGDTGLSMGYKK
jgi:hypothetical protein